MRLECDGEPTFSAEFRQDYAAEQPERSRRVLKLATRDRVKGGRGKIELGFPYTPPSLAFFGLKTRCGHSGDLLFEIFYTVEKIDDVARLAGGVIRAGRAIHIALVADAIEVLRPDEFRVAFREAQVAQIRGADFSGVYPHKLTVIGGIRRGSEEAGIAPASSSRRLGRG